LFPNIPTFHYSIIPSGPEANCACPPSLSLRRGGRERSELSSSLDKWIGHIPARLSILGVLAGAVFAVLNGGLLFVWMEVSY